MIKRVAAIALVGGLLFAGSGATVASAQERPQRRTEKIRLACRPATNGDQRGIGCRWTASKLPQFASYRLVRGTSEGREVVFRTEDRAATRYLDTDVSRGVRYRYAVLVLNGGGHIVGRSNVVAVGIPEG